MKNAPYSLATDGSNDNGLKKMNPLTVQIYDVNLKRVKTSLLDMCLSSGSTAEKLFQGINNCLAGHRIPWENCCRQHQCKHGDKQFHPDARQAAEPISILQWMPVSCCAQYLRGCSQSIQCCDRIWRGRPPSRHLPLVSLFYQTKMQAGRICRVLRSRIPEDPQTRQHQMA